MKKILTLFLSFFIPLFIMIIFIIILFFPIFNATSLTFPYAITPFDICAEYPKIWNLIKILYILSFSISYIIIYFSIYTNYIKHKKVSKHLIIDESPKSDLYLIIGKDENESKSYIYESRIISKYFNYRNYW